MPRPEDCSGRELFRLFQDGHPLRFTPNDHPTLSSEVEEILQYVGLVLNLTRVVNESRSGEQGLAQDRHP
jgi:hypothetical protein